jgi:hypothetical protein
MPYRILVQSLLANYYLFISMVEGCETAAQVVEEAECTGA